MEVFDKFHQERNQDLWAGHFSGIYRGKVVETNDPLRMHRVRVKVVDLYNASTEKESILWATIANWFGGGPTAGSWISPSIGDLVWVAFERGHPYNPVVIGFADPTRVKSYILDSIYGPPPTPFDSDGKPGEKPEYKNEDYLPKDERPYSMGFRSPYGQEIILNYTGFIPESHKDQPVEAGVDAITSKQFDVSKKAPESNQPDTKYMAFISGYGTALIMHDAGYDWEKEGIEHEQHLIDKYQYNLKFLNESASKNRDQRRFEIRTRAGHKFELRDVGFNKSRQGEYGDSISLTKNKEDERWIKIRTKGGHLFQMIDVGFDAEQDPFYKNLNQTEYGAEVENENSDLEGKDKRIIRMQTRHGHRIILDDRESNSINGDKSDPPGIGIEIQTRRGHYLGFNDTDRYNAVALQSARGQGIFIDDRQQYVAMSTETAEKISPVREGVYGAEWPEAPWRKTDPETNTFHLVLDNKNKKLRFKTPQLQGIEFSDGNPDAPNETEALAESMLFGAPAPSTSECNKPAWAEIRDKHDRGIYWNSDKGYMVMRGKIEKTTAVTTPTENKKPVGVIEDTSRKVSNESEEAKQTFVIDDNGTGAINIRNRTGTISIIAENDTIVISGKNIRIAASENVNIEAGGEISLVGAINTNPTHWTVKSGSTGTNKIIQSVLVEGRVVGGEPAGAPNPMPQPPAPEPVVIKAVEEHRPEPEKQDPCKSGEYKKDQQKADDAKKKAFDSKKKAENAYNKALDSRKNANGKLKSLHNERMSGGPSSSGYQQAKTEADAAVKQFKDDKDKAKEAIDENKKDYNDYIAAQELSNNQCAKEKCNDAKAEVEKAKAELQKANDELKKANADTKRAGTALDGDKEGDLEKRKAEAKKKVDEAKKKANEASKKVDEAKKKEKKACEKKKGARLTKRGCAPNKANDGDVPPMGGGGGPGGNTPPSANNTPTAFDPPVDPPEPISAGADEIPENDITPAPPYEPNPPDPISDGSEDPTKGNTGGNGGVLWYGVSEVWLQEIIEKGLQISSLVNIKNDPDKPENISESIELVCKIETIKEKDFVQLSQRRYGGKGVILRIKAVEDVALLIPNQINPDNTIKTFDYFEDIAPQYIEVYEIIPELPTLSVPIIKK